MQKMQKGKASHRVQQTKVSAQRLGAVYQSMQILFSNGGQGSLQREQNTDTRSHQIGSYSSLSRAPRGASSLQTQDTQGGDRCIWRSIRMLRREALRVSSDRPRKRRRQETLEGNRRFIPSYALAQTPGLSERISGVVPQLQSSPTILWSVPTCGLGVAFLAQLLG
jgi:hypothetical protein